MIYEWNCWTCTNWKVFAHSLGTNYCVMCTILPRYYIIGHYIFTSILSLLRLRYWFDRQLPPLLVPFKRSDPLYAPDSSWVMPGAANQTRRTNMQWAQQFLYIFVSWIKQKLTKVNTVSWFLNMHNFKIQNSNILSNKLGTKFSTAKYLPHRCDV